MNRISMLATLLMFCALTFGCEGPKQADVEQRPAMDQEELKRVLEEGARKVRDEADKAKAEAEEAAKKLEAEGKEAVEKLKDAGDEVKKAAEEAGDALKEGADKAKEALETKEP